MNDSRHFDAPWGTTLKVVSGLTCAVLASFFIFGLVNSRLAGPGRLALLLFPPLGIAAAGMFAIRGYQVSDGTLFVERPGWRSRVNLRGLQSVAVEPAALRRTMRTCGNGGFFSFTGWYWNKTLGHFRLFGTDIKRCVVLNFGKRRVVVTPGDPEAFAKFLTEQAALPSSPAKA